MNVMNIMKFAYSVEISLHSLMNSLMRLNESNEFINELNEWLMKFIKMTFCPKKYFIERTELLKSAAANFITFINEHNES